MREGVLEHLSHVKEENPTEESAFMRLWDLIQYKYTLMTVNDTQGIKIFSPGPLTDKRKGYLYILVESKVDVEVYIESFGIEFIGDTKIDSKFAFDNKYIFPLEVVPRTGCWGSFDFTVGLSRNFKPGNIIRLEKDDSKHEIKAITDCGELVLDNGKIVDSDDIYYHNDEVCGFISFKDKVMNFFRKIF